MSMMKNPHTRRLAAAAGTIALAAGMLGADGAFGQIRPADTKNVDEPGRLPYEQVIEFSRFGCSTTNCSNFRLLGGTFLFDAPPGPAGKRLALLPRDCLDRLAMPSRIHSPTPIRKDKRWTASGHSGGQLSAFLEALPASATTGVRQPALAGLSLWSAILRPVMAGSGGRRPSAV
jgi:hypothetical protein